MPIVSIRLDGNGAALAASATESRQVTGPALAAR